MVARTVVRSSVLGCATGGTEGPWEGRAEAVPGTGEEDRVWTGEGGNGNERDVNIAEKATVAIDSIMQMLGDDTAYRRMEFE